MNPADEVLDRWQDRTMGDSTSSVTPARVWPVGDRARVVDKVLLSAHELEPADKAMS